MINKTISVVMPSYGRAHLLKKTLPSYIQDNVIEVIVIDDCSPDNTEQVVKELQKEYPIIRYYRNNYNVKQAASKNVGIEKALGDYIYFGDDDSLLLPGSMKSLLETMIINNCDVVMARPIVAGPNYRSDKHDSYIKWRLKRGHAKNIKEIVDLEHLHFQFGKYLGNYIKPLPIIVPTCPACALVKTELARLCKFDPNFKGCAYREETDFFFRLNIDYNAHLMYDARAVQFNLPNYMVKNTGARAGGYSVWKQSAIECNLYFLQKNWSKICRKYNINKSIEEAQEEFENTISKERCKENIIKSILKDIYFKLFVY